MGLKRLHKGASSNITTGRIFRPTSFYNEPDAVKKEAKNLKKNGTFFSY